MGKLFADIFRNKNKTYKMTLMLAILEEVDTEGKALYINVKKRFLSFYIEREAKGMIVENPPENSEKWSELRSKI